MKNTFYLKVIGLLLSANLLITISCSNGKAFQTEAEKETELKRLSSTKTIIDWSLNKPESISSLSSNFNFQYSYNMQTGYSKSNPNPKYFQVTKEGYVKKSVYADDKSFSTDSDTFPRTELRGLEVIYDNVDYNVSFDQKIVTYPTYPNFTFDFCWFQVFGNGASNVMLRYRSGRYQLLVTMGGNPNLTLLAKLSDDIGVWTNWNIQFRLATSGGYVRVFRNGAKIGETLGNTSGGNNSYIKHGVYSQQMNPPSTMTSLTKNFILTSSSQ